MIKTIRVFGKVASSHYSPIVLRSMATLIDGKAIAAKIRSEIKTEVDELKAKFGKSPVLATVLVGDREDSAVYVRMKHKACAEADIGTVDRHVPATISETELVKLLEELNADAAVNGILVQLPLPSHINEERVLNTIGLEKDVDGFNPINIGRLCMKNRKALFEPCTPKGCIELLDRTGIPIEGKNAVVLGRSNIVGIPVANLLLHRNATVTIVHSRTNDIPAACRNADIIIAAIGQPLFVKKDWVKPGAAVIDVGINSVEKPDGSKKLVGDVDFEGVKEVAGFITPVPGGVGPMTIAMLLKNTVESFKRTLSS